MAAGYGADKAGEAMGLSPELRMLMSMGAMAATGYGAEALDARFNISGYHVPSKMPEFGFSDYMDSEDAARYNQHWDDLASGKNLPPGMDADDLARYNQGVQKLDENLALSRIDPDALVKLRAEEGARVDALLHGSIEGGLKPGTLSNVDARKWYLESEAKIPSMIDKNLPLEQQAKQAFDLRNQFRAQARELMSDRELAESLYKTDPNLTWEQAVQKQVNKGLSGDDIYKAIIESSQRSRTSVNESLGLK